jgi:hypothetical protein
MVRDILQQHGIHVRAAAEPAQNPLTDDLLEQLAEKIKHARSAVVSEVDVSTNSIDVSLYTRYGPQNEDEAVIISFELVLPTIKVSVGTLALTKPYPQTLDRKNQLAFLYKLVLDTIDAVQEYLGKGYTEACTLLEKQYFEAKSKLARLYKIKLDGKLPGFDVIFTEPG